MLKDYGLRAGRAIKGLSRGQRSALGITIGLAARAEVTLFDEPYAGLDAVARQVFYERLLADFAAFPRTVLLSTQLIDEAAALFESVVVIDRGRVALDAADGLRGMATTVSGPVLAVDSFTARRPVWERRGLGSQASVLIVGQVSADDRERAPVTRPGADPAVPAAARGPRVRPVGRRRFPDRKDLGVNAMINVVRYYPGAT